MLIATLITIAVWSVGAIFLTTDGQFFVHTVILVGSGVVSATAWLWQASRRQAPGRRIVAAVVLALNLMALVWLSVGLPEAWRKQQRFKAAATSNQALQRSYGVQAKRTGTDRASVDTRDPFRGKKMRQ